MSTPSSSSVDSATSTVYRSASVATASATSAGATGYVYVSGPSYCYSSEQNRHIVGIAAGVGIACGIVTAALIILAFVFFRRRQARKARSGPTISPDVLVRGPMGERDDGWEEYREETHGVVDHGKGGSVKGGKEPPHYTKI